MRLVLFFDVGNMNDKTAIVLVCVLYLQQARLSPNKISKVIAPAFLRRENNKTILAFDLCLSTE